MEIDMEMDMAKKSENKRGLTFEGKIDLSDWEFNRIGWEETDARFEMQEKIEKFCEKALDEYWEKIKPVEARIREIASEALQIALEKEVSAGFWEISENPEILTIRFNDLSEDGFSAEINIRDAVKSAVLDMCDDDGYVYEDISDQMLKFSELFSELAEYTKTSVRPK